MTERLIVSPGVGLFEPAPELRGYLPGNAARPSDPVTIEVGGLLGLVGDTEVRSAFAGSSEGVLVSHRRTGAHAASLSRGWGRRPRRASQSGRQTYQR